MPHSPFIGCAGWPVPKALDAQFPSKGTNLQRYATRLNAAEINTSFYKPHREATYARWAESTPPSFRFSVKMPKAITHEPGLLADEAHLLRFLSEIRGLGPKLGAILVQLPPHLRWDVAVAKPFFSSLRARTRTPIVCEPRHLSWFTAEVDAFFKGHAISRVVADPPIKGLAAPGKPLGDTCYFRLHGSPRMYYSSYDNRFLTDLAAKMKTLMRKTQSTWCIFDNTASGAAAENALTLQTKLKGKIPTR